MNESPTMQYSELDTILQPWAAQRRLLVATRYRDEEVRSMSIVDDAGDTYQLCVDPTAGAISVGVVLLSRAGRRTPSRDARSFDFSQSVPAAELSSALDAAWQRVHTWIAQAGHTRTPA